jgi:hypothetical protein
MGNARGCIQPIPALSMRGKRRLAVAHTEIQTAEYKALNVVRTSFTDNPLSFRSILPYRLPQASEFPIRDRLVAGPEGKREGSFQV